MGVMKGDTQSVDYSSCPLLPAPHVKMSPWFGVQDLRFRRFRGSGFRALEKAGMKWPLN